jgi:DNA-binding transcriptional regulator YiaG
MVLGGTPYDAAAVRRTRERLGASQAVFAKLVGVSKVLGQSWEQGARKPSKLARRLLDEINRDIERRRRRIA